MLETFLKTLSEELNLAPSFQQNKEQFYAVFLNPELEIKVKELDPGMLFFGKVGPCPALKKEELFIYLMKANFLGQGTGGASLGFDEIGNCLTLSLILPYDLNYKLFRDALEDFVNYIDYWKAELIRHQKTAEQSHF
jgi:Tir chaperone protein (CesT) family